MQRVGEKETASRLTNLTKEIEHKEEIESCHWRQRVRLNWLAYGDRNTRAFHAHASKRRRKNNIAELEDMRSEKKMKEEDKTAIICNFFSNLFKSSKPTKIDVDNVLEAVDERIGATGKALLKEKYEEKEVKKAIFDMHPTKDPGPDGFPARFFQRFWPEIGAEVKGAALRVLNGDETIEKCNNTLMTLIPKTKKPKKITEFRPLSLCNTTYKIVTPFTRLLNNRISGVTTIQTIYILGIYSYYY